MMMFATQALALPTLNNAGAGAGIAVDQLNSSTLRIVQSNARASASWSDFDIAVGETVRIEQPNAQAVLLNRITGQDATQILGTLQANGRVFLINPKGIVFGVNAQVDVGGLVASTLALKPGSQGQGQGQNQNNDIEMEVLADSGQIIQRGVITARDVALIAPSVENLGSIQAPAGRVRLLAAGEVTVNTASDFMVFQVQAGSEAALIEQLGQINSAGGEIFLLARSSEGGGASVINVQGIQQATRLTVQGDSVVLGGHTLQVTDTDVTADTLALQGLNATGNLSLSAGNITQTAAITVGGQTTLQNGNATLNNADNDFVGQLVVGNMGSVSVRDTNNLVLTGEAGQTSARADEQLTLSNLSASSLNAQANAVVIGGVSSTGNVTLNAGNITQTAAINVGGQTTLQNGNVTLSNANNNFTGEVLLEDAGQVSVRDANDLVLAGEAGAVTVRATGQLTLNNLAVSSLNAQADSVTLGDVSTESDLALNAGSTAQTAAIRIGGRSTLQGGGVTLNNAGNNFAGAVTLQNIGPVSLRDSNNLTVGGSAGAVTARAGGQLAVEGLLANSLDAQASAVVLSGFNTAGSMLLNAGSITQTAAVTVGGQTTIQNGNATLSNANNDFVGEVLLNNAGNVSLRDRNALSVNGQADQVNLQAAGQLAVGGLNAQAVELRGGQLSLGPVNTSGDLVLEAGSVNQTAAIFVGGQTTIRNGDATLNDAGNDFVGRVVLQNAGQVSLRDTNNLVLNGDAGQTTARSTGQLTLSGLSADTLDAQANAIVLDGFNATGNAVFNAVSTTQTDAIAVGGQTTFQNGSVVLNNAGNDFVGQVVLQDAGQVQLRDTSDVRVSGNAERLNVRADDVLRLNGVTLGSLQGQASGVVLSGLQSTGDVSFNAASLTQTAAVLVGGQTILQGGNVTLTHADNVFSGRVQLQGAGNVNLRGSNRLDVSGGASATQLQTQGVVSLRDLQTNTLTVEASDLQLNAVNVQQDMVINAGQTTQSGALAVGRQLTVEGGDVRLDRQDNRLQGTVALNSTGQAALASQTRVEVRGQTSALQATAQADLQLSNLTASSLQAQGAAVQLSGLRVSGDAQIEAAALTQSGAVQVDGRFSLQGGSANLRNTNNRFAAPVVLNHAGDVALAGQGVLDVQGLVQGNLTLDGTDIRQSQALSVTGRTTLRGNTVSLDQAANQFGAAVVLDDVQQANLRDVDTLSIQGRVGMLNAQAVDLTQGAELQVDGDARLSAQRVQLANRDNRFAGSVQLDGVAEASLQARGDLALHGQTRQLDVQAQGELVLDVQALEQLSVQAAGVHLVQANTTGNARVQADQITQAGALRVGGNLTMQGGSVELDDAGNDFQGTVALDGVLTARLSDANTLNVSGRVDNTLHLRAAQVEQHEALRVGNRLVVTADDVRLADSGNQFPNVSLTDSRQAHVRTTGDTLVTAGGRLQQLNVQADRLTLGELGRVESLVVDASALEQQAALNVGSMEVTSPLVRLGHAGNQINGVLALRSPKGGVVEAWVASQRALGIQAERLDYRGDVQGDLSIRAQSLQVRDIRVQGRTDLTVDGAVTQLAPVHLQEARVQAAELDWRNQGNRLEGALSLQVSGASMLGTSGDLSVDATASQGILSMRVGGDVNLQGDSLVLGDSQVQGNLTVSANNLAQAGALSVGGDSSLNVLGGTIALADSGNRLDGEVRASADTVNLYNRADLRLRALLAREGRVETNGRMLLLGDVQQGAGTLSFVAHHQAMPLSSADLAGLLPASLDVFSNREVVDPLTGLGRVFVAGAAIEQIGGTIATEVGANTRFQASTNGSVVLVRANRMQGSLSVLSGQAQAPYSYLPANGASLVAVNNELAMRVAAPGVEADLIAIRANGLDTPPGSVLRARMPYNDFGVGAARSFPALTLSVPMPTPGGTTVAGRGVVPFGEPGSSSGPNPRAIQVSVGETDSPGLGGFMTVLPFEGAALVPGQVIHLSGPGQSGMYNFFYDGAGSLSRIPVSYNGSVLLSPQETAALTSAQGAVVLARQEQTRSVVRTENVAGKVIQGVVVEVGPGRPATVGSGELNKPGGCDASDQNLSCAP
ncbi:MAG TPA: filamentous hemagglutinin N-terminal domain-containing protein [Limnobacter sp.]|nr:filamentous hemagglutinin N-terminal domain-containing protein [Limnobacter sp.]